MLFPFLFGPLAFEKDIAHDAPKILPIGAEGMLLIGLQITAFAFLDLVKAIRHVDIERGQKTRFGLGPKLLHFFGIEIEILLAQGAHAHQFHLPLKDIDEHGQLVQPSLAQEPAPLRHAIIVTELATDVEVVVLVDISLEILRIGIHRPELEHVELLSVLADAAQLDKHPVGMLLLAGLAFLLGDNTIAIVDVLLADHVETTIIQSSEHLGAGKHLTHPASAEVIEPSRQAHLWADPMPQKIKEIDDISKKPWITAEDLGTTLLGGVEAT